MKIPTAAQMREWDNFTIAHSAISSLDLMERAAQQCTDWIMAQKKFAGNNISIFCGKGNNGGDGLAIARQLIAADCHPKVYIAGFDEKESYDFRQNAERLQQQNIKLGFLRSESDFPTISDDSIIIDALFGFGLNRPVTGLYAQLIHHINEQNASVISIDIPSGMFTDVSSKGNAMAKASYTLTFETLKLCFLMAENADFFGNVHVLPIGLNDEFEKDLPTAFQLTSLAMVAQLYKPRKQFSHKGTYGHASLVAGNEGKMGAAIMSAKACLRCGVGLLTCSIPTNNFPIIHTTIAEAMVTERNKEPELSKFDVIGIGPGLSTGEDMAQLFHSILQQYQQPMVIDADALNILSQHKDWLRDVPTQSVLTPHPKEFDRLFGDSNNDFERMNKAFASAKQYNVIIALKGTYSFITDGNMGYFNNTGNNGMATGGSGDVLTGMITALLAQQYSPFNAAVVAVYVHGMAADFCLQKQSYESLLPTDMIEEFGTAFKVLQNNKGT